MLFCCLWCNAETSCHKHFVFVSHYQQTPPLTTSGKVHILPRSDGTVLITPSRSQRWQHVMKPDIGSESRFLPTPPAFDAPVKRPGSTSEYCHDVWYGKTRIVWLPNGEKVLKIRLFVLTKFTNVTDRHTDTAWRHRPRLHIASRGN